jgi:hypothetical protein
VRYLVVLTIFAIGCSFDSSALAPESDAAPGEDAATDVGLDDADSAVSSDAIVDALLDAPVDGRADGGVAGRCPEGAIPSGLALYTFEGIEGAATTTDLVGGRVATVRDGAVSARPGPDGCGDAVYFPEGNRAYLLIADAPEWDLPEGSLDFWVQPHAPITRTFAFFSRDAGMEANPGHIRMVTDSSGRPSVRIQDGDTETGHLNLRPDGPLSVGEWHHIGIVWGPGGGELWIDGVMVDRSDLEWGLDGNDNPWTIGADNSGAEEGSDPPSRVRSQVEDLAIDHFRISATRREFGAYAELAPTP